MFPDDLKDQIRNVHAYAVTPFNDDLLSVDLDSYTSNIEFMLDRGVKGEPTRGKTERPALNALLKINKAAANALPSSFTRPNDALHGRCSKGCQERFVFQERIDAVLL